jgi:hypothetical protein
MIISSRRVGPRLPAMGEWHDQKPAMVNGVANQARESWTLVLVATTGAGRPWLGSGQAVRCHYLAAYPAVSPPAMR